MKVAAQVLVGVEVQEDVVRALSKGKCKELDKSKKGVKSILDGM